MFRKYLIDLLTNEPRSVSSVARELGLRRAHVEDDLRHAIRSARARGQKVQVLPARCKTCDFVFGEDKLSKPSRCPACKGTRLFEPMIRISAGSERDLLACAHRKSIDTTSELSRKRSKTICLPSGLTSNVRMAPLAGKRLSKRLFHVLRRSRQNFFDGRSA
jgi:predicted Zn-ribbon and HTH transcriptional regulator